MSDVESLGDLVACRLCFALTTREGRVLHLDWHARLSAKVYGWPNKVVSTPVVASNDYDRDDARADSAQCDQVGVPVLPSQQVAA